MKTLTSLIVGTCLLLGSALAAQSSTTTPKAPVQKTSVNKKKTRKHKKSVAQKPKATVTPVAAKKN